MEGLHSLLMMGGYAAYVWPCYGLALVVMAGLLIASWKGAKARQSELETLQRLRQDRPRRRAGGAAAAEETSR